MGSNRSLGRGIHDIASTKCLVVSAMNCTRDGCIPSLSGGAGGGGGNSSSLFSSGRRLKSQRGRRLGGMILYLKEQLSHILHRMKSISSFLKKKNNITFKTNQ
jgi:hypothetical protein